MTFKCKLCKDKEFKTYAGLWKHNNKIHKNNHDLIKIINKIYNCSYCNKEYKHYQSKWTHEQKCKKIDKTPLADKVQQLTEKIKELETKPLNITNNTTNNTTNNIQLIIRPPGFESIEHLSINQQREIMQKGLNSLTYLIEINNFNKDIPENHSYCVTALNDKHASIINPDTNLVIKTDKNTLFDKILVSNLKNLERISSNPEFKYSERNEYKEKIKTLKDLLFINRKGLKRYYFEINLLSYNNKDLILETWATLKNLDNIINHQNKLIKGLDGLLDETKSDSSEESEDEEMNVKRVLLKNLVDKNLSIKQIKPIISQKELESTDDSECSESETEIIHYIEIKGIKYILEDSNVFEILKNGIKGKIYGTYLDGKFKKKSNKKDIDV